MIDGLQKMINFSKNGLPRWTRVWWSVIADWIRPREWLLAHAPPPPRMSHRLSATHAHLDVISGGKARGLRLWSQTAVPNQKKSTCQVMSRMRTNYLGSKIKNNKITTNGNWFTWKRWQVTTNGIERLRFSKNFIDQTQHLSCMLKHMTSCNATYLAIF